MRDNNIKKIDSEFLLLTLHKKTIVIKSTRAFVEMRKTTLAWLVSDERDTHIKKSFWKEMNYRISKYSQAQLTLRSKAHIKFRYVLAPKLTATPAHDLLIIQYLEWEPNESVNALAPKSYDIIQCPKRNQASRTVAMLKKSYKVRVKKKTKS
ncbi:unnamed protein product [Rhizophagus irregularis]|nr:unnamed protein product [Rhizophagus irregularis]